MHSKKSLSYHYKAMAQRNWMDHINNREIVNCKKYFYIMRPIAMLHYLMIESGDSLNDDFTIDFNKIMSYLLSTGYISKELYDNVQILIENKKNGTSLTNSNRIIIIDAWISEIFDKFVDVYGEDGAEKKIEMTKQSFGSIFKKLENQYRKIISITRTNNEINKSDYLSCIGFALQFLYLKNDNNKNFNDIPSKFTDLLDYCTKYNLIDDIVILETNRIIENSGNSVTKYTDIDDKQQKIVKDWINMFLQTLNTINKDYKSDVLRDKIRDLDNGDNYKHVIEYILKDQFLNLFYYLTHQTFETKKIIIPKDTIQSIEIDKPTLNIIHKLFIKELGQYMVPTNIIINEWLDNLIKDNVKFVNEKLESYRKMKDLATEARFNNSLKKVDILEFDQIFIDTCTASGAFGVA